jgi:surfeit locus 1 family protein
MTQPAERFPWLATILLIPALAILLALGFWQVERLQWKTDLIRRVEAARTGAPRPAEQVLRDQAAGRSQDYARVSAVCPDIERTPYLRVYAIREGEPGYRLVTLCTLASGPYRTLLIDRGFVLQDDLPRLASSQAQRRDTPVIGVLRLAGKPGWMTPPDEPAKNIWRSRNIPAMAAALHAPAPAPLFMMMEGPKPQGFGPTPESLPVDIPNSHLGYAMTWFGLALALVAMYGSMLFKRYKARRSPPHPQGDSR